jgi:predicted ester cyclase
MVPALFAASSPRFAAFPDIHIDVERVVSTSDSVAAEVRVTGTHSGRGLPTARGQRESKVTVTVTGGSSRVVKNVSTGVTRFTCAAPSTDCAAIQ